MDNLFGELRRVLYAPAPAATEARWLDFLDHFDALTAGEPAPCEREAV